MSVQEFITSITAEKDGYMLDEAWRMSEESLSVIVPIKRVSDEKRDYITFAEAQNIKVEDTGMIDYVFVQNNEEKPVLISRGEIFRGKTQERAAIHGHIIMAGKGMRVNVRCIHKTKGIVRGSEMKYGGRTPYEVNLSSQQSAWNTVDCLTKSYNSTLRGVKLPGATLSEVGVRSATFNNTGLKRNILKSASTTDSMTLGVSASSGVEMDCLMQGNMCYSSSVGSTEPQVNIPSSDDLAGTLDDMAESIKEAMKRIPPIENQVGAIFIYENKVKGMDIYNLPDSWKTVKEDVIKKEGSDFIKKEDNNIFEFKPEKVKALIGKELSCKFEEKVIYGETQGQDYKIIEYREVREEKDKGKRLMGEAVEFLGKIIHLTMYRA